MVLPKGEHTLTIQVQPIITASKQSESFKPVLYYAFIQDGEALATANQIDYPPSGSAQAYSFAQKRNYDSRNFMQVTLKHTADTKD